VDDVAATADGPTAHTLRSGWGWATPVRRPTPVLVHEQFQLPGSATATKKSRSQPVL
jgi:hypothetical protein